MLERILRLNVALWALLLLAAPADAEIVAIVRQGDTAPGGGQFDLLSLIPPSINANGQVAFSALLENTSAGSRNDSGMYLYDGSAVTEVYREDDPLPDGNGVFSSHDGFVLNDDGKIVFRANLNRTSGGNSDRSGIYLFTGIAMLKQARANTPVPDGNGLFYHFTDDPVMNSAGQTAFVANVDAAGIVERAVYSHNGVELKKVVRIYDPVPGGDGQFGYNYGVPAIDHDGRVAFEVELLNTSAGTTNGFGVFSWNGASLTTLARANDLAPEGNGRFSFFSDPVANAGRTAFTSTLRNTQNGNLDNQGIYLHDGQTLTNILRSGQPVPEGNGVFNTLPNVTLQMNTPGQILFNAGLRGTSDGIYDSRGLYLYDNGTIRNLIRAGQTPPDGNGRFFQIFPAGLTNSGLAVVRAELGFTSDVGDDNIGIYLTDGQETVKVVRESDMLDGRRVRNLDLLDNNAASGAGRSSPINDFGQVTFLAYTVGLGEGIYVYTPDLRWRAGTSGTWDSPANWTLGLRPGAPHPVQINPSTNLNVQGPTTATSIKSLSIGGGAGVATLTLQSGVLQVDEGISILTNGKLAGNGAIEADLSNAGMLAPGASAGVIEIQGNYTQGDTGRLVIEVASPTSFDQLLVGGHSTLGGTLELVFINGFTPTGPLAIDFLASASQSGAFQTAILPDLPGDATWDVSQISQGIVSVVPEPSAFALAICMAALAVGRRPGARS